MHGDLLNIAPCGYLIIQDDGTIVYANHTLLDWIGYTSDELKGKNTEVIFTVATRIFYNTHLFPLIKLHGKAEEIFISLCTKSKKDIPVITNAERRTENGEHSIHCVFLPVHQRRKYEDEILKAKRDAEEALKENKHLEELRHSLENRTLELERQYQKQLSINENLLQFSKIISHDLQEPLHKISIFTDVVSIAHNSDPNPRTASAIEKVKSATHRLKTLITGLEGYIAVDAEKAYSDVDLDGLFKVAAAKAKVYRNFDEVQITSENLPTIQGYKTQLELMLFHLIDNSIQFREPSRKLEITISGVALDENLYKITKEKYKFTEHIRLTYSDNGIGFDNKYKDYVFALLKKTDAKAEGLGLGLSLLKKIVDNHRGSVNVESEKGKGSVFTITLPVKVG
jgi:sigma-B regulation protein RsbU (phosphoserine phosphatase)